MKLKANPSPIYDMPTGRHPVAPHELPGNPHRGYMSLTPISVIWMRPRFLPFA